VDGHRHRRLPGGHRHHGRVHVPRNDALKSAGDPDEIDLPAVRAAFDEQRWATWNIVRASVCTSAFACLVLALVEYGRTL